MLGSLLLMRGANQILLGYSGVIFGVLVAQALFFPNSVIVIFYFFPMKMKHAAILLGAVALYLTIMNEGRGAAHAAHLFGAAAAFVYLRGYRQIGAARFWRALRAPMKGRAERIKRERTRRKNRIETPWKL